MKRLLYLLIFSINSSLCYSQDNSILYNKNRTLKSDTTISISKKQFEIWSKIEEDLLSNFFNQFETPQFFLDAGMKFSWVFSFQYDIDSKQFYNVKIQKSLHGNSFPKLKKQDQNMINSVQTALNKIKYGFVISKLKNNESTFIYYIPIILNVERVKDFINQSGVLQLKSASPALIKSNITVH